MLHHSQVLSQIRSIDAARVHGTQQGLLCCHPCRYIFEVDEMGKTIDMLNVATIRSRYMYMCQVPGWSNSPACKGLLDVLRKRLLGNIQAMQMGHQGLYLGFEQLRVLKDQELYVSSGICLGATVSDLLPAVSYGA